MAVVPRLQVLGEALAPELLVHGLEPRDDAGEEGLDVEGRGGGSGLREQVGERGRRARVGCVDADAEDDLVGAVEVAALGEDAADLDVGLGGGWLCGIESVYYC